MTIFSTVTATLAPELASCMKAKGKPWKEAFFDSLKTLVGVDYSVYRKENQWQIKGRWDDVKKAFNILSKVALIEKDAIAAYHAGVAEESARAARLASSLSGGGLTSDSLGLVNINKRRRGRPPKKRPYIEPRPPQPIDANTPLPPKRKRGRPRKVKVEDFKLESEDDDLLEPLPLRDHPAEMISQEPDPTLHGTLGDNIEPPKEGATLPTHSNSENASVFPESIIIAPVMTENLPGDAPPPTEPAEDLGTNSSAVAVASVHEHSVQSVLEDQNQSNNPTEGTSTLDPSIEHANHINEQALDQKYQSLNDQFSDVAIAVAKEAIACAGVQECRLSDSSRVQDPAICGNFAIQQSFQLPTLPPAEPEQGSLDPETENAPQSSSILEYLGIKQKYTGMEVDEFAEDHERFPSEQSKKLEELIEKMIEKMDKTLKDPLPPMGLKYICAECPFTSQKKSLLREHMRKAHTDHDDAYIEDDGEEPSTSTNTGTSVVHSQKRFLGPRKLYRCFECNYSSNSRKHLKEHKLRKHREKALKCHICTKRFAVERDLTRHMKDHDNGDVRYPCEICGKKYKQHYVMKRHMEIHEDGYIKPTYPCSQCEKSFAAKQVLQIHINAVHLGKRPSFPCPTCGKCFTTKHSLSEHQLIHTNVKPYECKICKKSFRHESTLKTHERLHTDTTQQYTCEYCGKAFRLRSSLRIHRNIHTGDKRFDCPICKKVFTQKQSLLRHARIHTGEKPFQCEICGSAFYDYSILRRHVTGVHKMTWKSPTQHYVLPPDSYMEDGKIIEAPPSGISPLTSTQHMGHLGDGMHTPGLGGNGHHEHQQPLHQPLQQSHVYQPPPMPHTPHALPEPAHTSQPHTTQAHTSQPHTSQPNTAQPHTSQQHASQQQPPQAHNLSMRHLGVSDHLDRKIVSSGSVDGDHHHHQQQQQATYHSSLVSQNIYQSPHIPLPNTLPSAMPLTQQQPLPSPTPSPMHHPPPMQSPPPPQHPMSPLSPMTMVQYQQQAHGPPHTSLSLPSAYSLNQQIYYQSHP